MAAKSDAKKTDQRRRTLLGAGLVLGASGAGLTDSAAAQTPVFQHGVASGEPAPTSMLLWTRLSTNGSVAGRWQVATDAAFANIVATGDFATGPERDHCVKVDAGGLSASTNYWYRFEALGQKSVTGRMRTLPIGTLAELRLALVCCAMYTLGRFHGYAAIARERQLDAVLFVGDYIYEYGPGFARPEALLRLPDPPHDAVTLNDYRRRYAQAHSDASLQAAHARAPWICMWDDHEIANDDWSGGAEHHDPARDGEWAARKAAAVRAYLEWMPVREPTPGAGPYDIYRSFIFGDLATLILPETRLKARDKQLTLKDLDYTWVDASDPTHLRPVAAPAADGPVPENWRKVPDVAGFRRKIADPTRQMLGQAQLQWLEGQVRSSTATGQPWVLLGSPTIVGSYFYPDLTAYLAGPGRKADKSMLQIKGLERFYASTKLELPIFNLDSWDGYASERERMYQILTSAGARTVVLSGDSHMAWANELHYRGQRIGVEVSASTVTGPSMGKLLQFDDTPFGELVAQRCEDVRWCDHTAVGYVRVHLTRQNVVAEFVGVNAPRAIRSGATVRKRWQANAEVAGVGPWLEASG